ncbi:MAG: hypothetical protein AB1598_14580 [Thermodesulfobacteriota bacterium]
MSKVMSALSMAAMMLVLGACAAIQGEQSKSTEELLAAAGFQIVAADTPEEMNMLNSLTPNKVQFSVRDNKPLYWYADPYNCKCVWTGDQAAYDRYENLVYESNLVDEEQEAAMMAEQAEFGPGLWGWAGGPWGW